MELPKLSKYFIVAKNTWEEILTYRLNFVMWRVRVLLQIVTLYYLWFAIMPKQGNLFGYDKSLMLTYILGTSVFGSIVLSTRSHEVGEQIVKGELSNLLLKPVNYFIYWFSKDLGDKAMNIVFSLIELSVLFIILNPPLYIEKNVSFILFSFASSILAVMLYFLFSIILGFIGFWSPETWAPRFIFTTILSFFAGGLFPLDVLPKNIFHVLNLLPFPYLLYFPIKIYLGKISVSQIFFSLEVSFAWVIIMFFMALFVWRKGLRTYEAYGK